MSPLTEPTKLTLAKSFTWNETVWNPSMIQTALWLDAADASTVFTTDTGSTLATNASAVGRWNDKSGSNYNATQSTSGNRPAYTTNSLNGRNILSFTKASNHFMQATILNYARDNFTLYMVARATNYNLLFPNSAGIFGAGVGSNAVFFDNGAASISNAGTANSASQTLGGSAGPHIVAVGRSGNNAFCTVNGAAASTTTTYGTLSGSATTIWLGRYDSSGNSAYMDGYIAELLLINNYDSSAATSKTLGYLAWKWGLTANLPAGHPYKTVGPTP